MKGKTVNEMFSFSERVIKEEYILTNLHHKEVKKWVLSSIREYERYGI